MAARKKPSTADKTATPLRSPKPSTRAAAKTPFERAYARAIRLLKHHDRTRAELRTRLDAAGFDALTIDAVITKLGPLANDARTAENAALQIRAKAPAASGFVRASLEARGIAEPLARRAGGDETLDPKAARALAKQLAARIPERLDPPTRWRRLLSGLARRGFDEETSLEAARRVLGEPPDM